MQRGACPLPYPAHFTSSGKLVSVLGDGRGVPVFEPDVTTVEVNIHWLSGGLRAFLNWLVIWGTGFWSLCVTLILVIGSFAFITVGFKAIRQLC